jgi:hypothetical protein
MGELLYRSTYTWHPQLLDVSDQLHSPAALPYWIGDWMGPRTGLDDLERRKILPLRGLELRPLDRSTRSQSLYLCYMTLRELDLLPSSGAKQKSILVTALSHNFSWFQHLGTDRIENTIIIVVKSLPCDQCLFAKLLLSNVNVCRIFAYSVVVAY